MHGSDVTGSDYGREVTGPISPEVPRERNELPTPKVTNCDLVFAAGVGGSSQSHAGAGRGPNNSGASNPGASLIQRKIQT